MLCRMADAPRTTEAQQTDVRFMPLHHIQDS